jgi:hypothetical protein
MSGKPNSQAATISSITVMVWSTGDLSQTMTRVGGQHMNHSGLTAAALQQRRLFAMLIRAVLLMLLLPVV